MDTDTRHRVIATALMGHGLSARQANEAADTIADALDGAEEVGA